MYVLFLFIFSGFWFEWVLIRVFLGFYLVLRGRVLLEDELEEDWLRVKESKDFYINFFKWLGSIAMFLIGIYIYVKFDLME